MVRNVASRVGTALTGFYGSIIAIAVVSRILLTFANWFTLSVLPMVPNFNPGLPDSYLPNDKWIDGWARWDTVHYVIIATEGYGPAGTDREGQGTGFFPAFPLAMRLVAWFIGDSTNPQYAAIAGVIVANLCFLAATLMLGAYVNASLSQDIALTSVILLSFSPVSFFFSAAYTESLFVMTVIGAFLLAERGRWLGSSLFMAVASATRLFGLVLIPAVMYIAWREKEPLRTYVPLLLVAPLGTISYFGWLWLEYGNPLKYFDAQSNWGDWNVRVGNYIRQLLADPTTMFSDPMRLIIMVYVGIAFFFALSLPLAWKVCHPAVAGFSTFMVLFHSVYTWNSLGRYMLPAIGCFIGVAWLLEQPRVPRWVGQILIGGMAILMTTLSVLYAHGYWVI